MRFHFLWVPVVESGEAEAALNAFLAAHRVIAVDRHFVPDGARSAWAVCVNWVEGAAPGAAPGAAESRKTARVDYRESLSPEHFAVYVRLRDLRKKLAEREGVPPYAVLTNEQMAEIARRDVQSLDALGKIEGIGPARSEKYGEAVLEALRHARAERGPGGSTESGPGE